MSEDQKLTSQVDSILSKISKEEEAQKTASDQPKVISDSEMEILERDAQLGEKYGNRGLETGAIGAASGLSFGVSDQLLTKLGIYSPEELRNLRDENAAASTIGEVTGVVGGLLTPTGQAGAAARVLGTAGKAVKGASKAATATEKLTAKAMNKLIAETGERKFAKDVIKKAVPLSAGSTVEGSAYGLGELVRENALGTAEFNAENLVASLGGGALIGGAFGAGIGAAMPLLAKGAKVGKVTADLAKQKALDITDPEGAALSVFGFTPSRTATLKQYDPHFVQKAPKFLIERLNLRALKSNEDLIESMVSLEQSASRKIPQYLNKIDELAASDVSLRLNRKEVLDAVNKELDSVLIPIASKRSYRDAAKQIRSLKSDIRDEIFAEDFVSANTLNSLRKFADDKSQHGKLDNPSQLNIAARKARRVFRNKIDEMADLASKYDGETGLLSKNLKQANEDIYMIKTSKDSLFKKAEKGNLLPAQDILLGGLAGYGFGGEGLALIAGRSFLKSDFKNKLTVLAFAEKQNQRVAKKVSDSIKSFIKGSKAPASALGTATKASLVQSLIAVKPGMEKEQKPKDEQQAFRQIRENILELATNPEKLEKRAIMSTAGLSLAAPETALAATQILQRAVILLNEKLPQTALNIEGIKSLDRPVELSDLELAKFKRYVTAIESPMTLLDDLQAGTATMEQVEAVKAVYPDLYGRIVQETYDYIAESEDLIPYNKRVQLGTLLGIPTDSSLRPDALADLQSNFGKAGEGEDPQQQGGSTAAQGQAPGRLSVTGLREMDIAARENSEAQNFISRKRN